MSGGFQDLTILPVCRGEITILHKDAEFLLVSKPERLLSVPGRHPKNRDSVIARIQSEYPTAAIVHRLDFDTSGIMVVPLSPSALSHISKQFQARSVHKTYTAVVHGLMEDDEGVIDLPIATDSENRPKYKICFSEGKKSVTEYKVLVRDRVAHSTRVSLHPITGRSHQLRLHLQAIGYPILGCEFYADELARAKSPRLLLHATELAFAHPLTGEKVSASCAVPF